MKELPAPEATRTLAYALQSPTPRGGYLIREARLRAGVSQAELASRLKTSQSLVARWENDSVSPLYSTVTRAVRACGLELSVSLCAYDCDHDVLIDDQLALSVTERVRRMAGFQSTIARLRARDR